MIEITEESRIINAKIKFSYLGFDQDNQVIWWQLGFDTENGTYITEKVCLNRPDQIANILKVLDLHNWEEVARKFARIKVIGKRVIGIGNLIENRWLLLKTIGE